MSKIRERIAAREKAEKYLRKFNCMMGYINDENEHRFGIYTRAYFKGDSKFVGYIDGRTFDLNSIEWVYPDRMKKEDVPSC